VRSTNYEAPRYSIALPSFHLFLLRPYHFFRILFLTPSIYVFFLKARYQVSNKYETTDNIIVRVKYVYKLIFPLCLVNMSDNTTRKFDNHPNMPDNTNRKFDSHQMSKTAWVVRKQPVQFRGLLMNFIMQNFLRAKDCLPYAKPR
jgi:hypothetical protein